MLLPASWSSTSCLQKVHREDRKSRRGGGGEDSEAGCRPPLLCSGNPWRLWRLSLLCHGAPSKTRRFHPPAVTATHGTCPTWSGPRASPHSSLWPLLRTPVAAATSNRPTPGRAWFLRSTPVSGGSSMSSPPASQDVREDEARRVTPSARALVSGASGFSPSAAERRESSRNLLPSLSRRMT